MSDKKSQIELAQVHIERNNNMNKYFKKTTATNESHDTNDILKYIVKNDIIPADTMLDFIETMERKRILEKHPYAITETTDKKTGKTQYCTYLPTDIKGKRIYKRRNTRKELEDFLISYYKEKEEQKYLSTVYHEWIEKKLNDGDIKQETYDRYNDNFKRFFVNYKHPITKKQFKHITEDDLENYIKSVIRNLGLTRKAYEGCRTLIKGIFKFAKKRNYTYISITHFLGDLQLSSNLFKRRVINKKTEVFNEDEIVLVTKYLSENADIYNLGILLAFHTGLRVGELSALKPTDIDEQIIKIQRTEIKYRDENNKWKVKVRDDAKTEAGNRDLIIPTSTKGLWNKIIELNPNGEYLFENRGKRIRGNTFNKRLTKICDELNIPRRSMHKIRKTYATTLIDSDVSEGFIQEQMGHSDINTTRKLYYFSNQSEQKKYKQIEEAISF